MKRILMIGSLCMVLAMTCEELFAKNKGFAIHGKLAGINDGTKISLLTAVERKEAYLRLNDINDTIVSETTVLNGQFKFTGFITHPAKIYKIKIEGKDQPLVLAMLNETVTIKGSLLDWPRIDVKNCTYFSERKVVEREFGFLRNKILSANVLENMIRNDSILKEAQKKFIIEFAGKRLNSAYIPYLFLLHDFTAAEKRAFYDKFTKDVKNSYYGTKLKAQIEFLDQLEGIKENAVIPAFNLITSEGSNVSILELAQVSDYTLLYFWFKDGRRAWEQHLPVFKKLSAKLKARGVNLINVNIDRREEDWKLGMKEFNAPGLHARFEKQKSEILLFDLYNTPSEILIDRNGRMLSFRMYGSRIKSFGFPFNIGAFERTIDQLPKVGGQVDKGFSLKGKIKGLKANNTCVLLSYSDKKGWDPRFTIPWDTIFVPIINSEINFSGKVPADGKFYALGISGEREFVPLLISDGEQIVIKGNIDNWPNIEVTGSIGTADMIDYQKTYKSLIAENKLTEISEFRRNFLATQIHSLYAAYVILMNKEMSAADRKLAYERLTPTIKKSYFGLKLGKAIEENTLYHPMKEGYTIPDFIVTTTDGKKENIHKIISQSKYTLIDFWASWCGPCRKGFLELLKADSMYRQKGLGIVGIAVNDTEKDWKKALSTEKTTWTMLFDQSGKLDDLFSMGSIPTMILVDQQGKLITFQCAASRIASFGPFVRGEELFKTLDDLFR